MATVSKNYGQVKLTSSYLAYTKNTGSGNTYRTSTATNADSATFYADFATLGIPAGSTVNSAQFTYTQSTSPLHGFDTKALMSGSTTVDSSFNSGDSVMLGAIPSFFIRFRTGKTNTTYPATPGIGVEVSQTNSSTWTIDNLTLTVDYTLPYTAVTAPTTVSVSPTSGGPSFASTLSWSGASGGTNNPIKHYQVQRSIDGGAWQNLTTTTSTSVTVNGSASNNGKHAYRIISIATQSGYDSGASSSATQTTTFSAPTAPTAVSVSSAYVTGGNVTLSWSGATAGTNNPIKSYSIYRNGSAYTTSTSTSVSVPSNTAGNYYTYTVYTIGTHSNSGASSGATVYTYTNPTAPTNVKVAQTVINAGTSTTLSWTAGSNGHYNAISEYHVYRRTNGSGNYTYLNKTTGTSLSVTAHSTMTSYYDYVVYSIGLRSNSGASGSARLTTKNYTKVNAPTTVSVSSTHVTGGNVTLSWSGASGGTNTTVASYQVYRDGTAYGDPTTGSSMAVPSASAGNSYTYTVVAISSPAGYNSSASSGAIVRTYGKPSAPTTVTINGVAGTTYFGNQGRPTITLAWSGASAGTYGSISKYIVYRDGANPIETTSTSMVVTADGTYTVRTVASGGTSDHSVGRAVTTIGAPTFNKFTVQPSGKSNGNVSYSWSANAAPANSSLVYHVAYRNGGTGSTWIAGTGATASYTFNVNSYITQGNYYQLGVLVRANATHGGYRDATAGYVFSSANTAYRAAAPAKPTNLVFKDQGGNTSYSTNQVDLTFSYSIPTRGASVSRYEIFYKYGKTGGYTKLVDNYNGSVTHNIASVAAGLQIYYKVEVVDEYGYRNSVESGDTYITKLVMPTISNASFTPTDVPNTAGKLVFTPGNGGVSRPLKYSARILYNGQSYSLTGFTEAPSPGSALTFTKTGMGINVLNSAGMTSLFSYVITNANVTPVITVEITVADNQTIPVVGNQTVHTFTYTANYRTTPTLSGTLTLSNATATANSKTIDYMNSEDELAVSTSGMSVSWLNAAGTAVGQNLTYRLTHQGITANLSGFPSGNLVKTMLGVFTGDTTVTASLVIIQSFNGGVTTSSATKNASISAKRFIKPSITFANSERTAGTVFKTRIGISDSLCGGSSTANNIENITSLEITAGTTVNTVQNSAVALNKWKINDTVVPVDISNLNASAIADVSVSASATLTLSSGRTVTINSTPFLLKALGVALAIRKTRVGINVEPTSFLDTANTSTFVVTARQQNTSGHIMDLVGSVDSPQGVSVQFQDIYAQDGRSPNSGVLLYKNNQFRVDKELIFRVADVRGTDWTPAQYQADRPFSVSTFFNDQYGSVWDSGITVAGWSTGYQVWQLAAPSSNSSNDKLRYRVGINSTWQPWRTILHDGNYSSYALPLTGGTMSGGSIISFSNATTNFSASSPMQIGYARIASYATLSINANTDNSGTEYLILTAGQGLSSSVNDGVAIGTNTFTWKNNPVLTSVNYSSYVTPAGIGAAASSHSHSYVPINDTLGGVYVSRNAGGIAGSVTGSNAVGAIRLDLGTANQMLNARITIRSYTYLATIIIGGYTYTATTAWHLPQAYGQIDGGDLKVRFCSSGTSRYITIGDTNTGWSGYPFVTIDELNSGYANTHLQNIPVSLVTAYPGTVNNTITIPGGVNITSNNYTSYAPTLTGTGASGTWNITAAGNLPLTGGTLTGHIFTQQQIYMANNKYLLGASNSGSYYWLAGMDESNKVLFGDPGATSYIRSTYNVRIVRGGTEYIALDSGNYNAYITPANIGAAASSHSHNYLDNYGSSNYYTKYYTTSPANDFNNITNSLSLSAGANGPFGGGYTYLQNFIYADVNQRAQLAISYAENPGRMAFRTLYSGVWRGWYEILHSGNYTSYAPTLTGTGASGTWGINISGTAADSSKLGGLSLGNATAGTHPGANAVVRTDSNGYLNVGWINTVSGTASGTPTRIYCSQDAYLRYYAPDNATLRRSMKAYITYGASLPTSGMATGDIFIKI